ncbi:hypothetical protein V8G54_018153, partial [Vigna mungo]
SKTPLHKGITSTCLLGPFRFLHIPIPPSLDTDKDRGCRTSLGLPPPAATLSLLTLDSPFFLFQSFELTSPLEPNPITFLSLSQTFHRWRRIAAPTTQNSFSKPNSLIRIQRATKLGQHFVGDNGGASGGRTVAARRWTQRATREKNQTAKWRFLCAREMEDAKTIRLVMEVRLVAMEIGLVAVEVAGEEGGGRRGRRIERRHARRRRNLRKLLRVINSVQQISETLRRLLTRLIG